VCHNYVVVDGSSRRVQFARSRWTVDDVVDSRIVRFGSNLTRSFGKKSAVSRAMEAISNASRVAEYGAFILF